MNKKYTVDWFSQNIKKFEHFLKNIKDQDNVHGLEIGSFEGRSSCWFLDNVFTSKKSTLTCIDTWEGSMENTEQEKEFLWKLFSDNIKNYPSEKVIVKRGFSRDRLRDPDLKKYDFIYVDGSHTTRDVLGDAVLCFDLLKIGGIMTFDDYLWALYPDPLLCPRTGIDGFLICYAGKYELLEKAYQVTIKKIAD